MYNESENSQDEHLALLLSEDLDRSFVKLVTIYQYRLYGFILRQTGNTHDAEDITQEALMRAYFALKSYSTTQVAALKLQPWLYKITLNVFYSHRNTSRIRCISLDLSEEHLSDFDKEDQSPSPEEEIWWREYRSELENLIAQLPPRYSLAINLRYFADLNYQEIAELLHQPSGTIKSNIHRGIKLLRQMHGEAHLNEVK